jgi:hypothetical protein
LKQKKKQDEKTLSTSVSRRVRETKKKKEIDCQKLLQFLLNERSIGEYNNHRGRVKSDLQNAPKRLGSCAEEGKEQQKIQCERFFFPAPVKTKKKNLRGTNRENKIEKPPPR